MQISIEKTIFTNCQKSRPLTISASTLKFGDRFFLEDDKSLWFKLDLEPTNNQYLCSNDRGETKLLDGNIKVTRINGIRDSLYSQAKQIVEKYLES